MLKGKLVGLTALEREDLKPLRDWRNIPEYRKHFREYRELSMDHQKTWYEEKVLKDPATMMFGIRSLSDNELLGCCGFVYIDWVHRHADLSLYVGWKHSYVDEVGYADESCRLLLDYGFKELCLNKIWTEIYEFDDKKKALYDRFGFQQDGLLRQNYFYDGRFWDSRIISLLAESYLT